MAQFELNNHFQNNIRMSPYQVKLEKSYLKFLPAKLQKWASYEHLNPVIYFFIKIYYFLPFLNVECSLAHNQPISEC